MSPERNAPPSRKVVGQAGEDAAARFLETRGYRIIARNWRAGRAGEIDLIATSPVLNEHEPPILVFVEVKTRRSRTYGRALEAVDERKCAQMLRVAEAYLNDHHPESHPQVRFDVIAVTISGPRLHIEHLENVIN